jgi:hypothetical protein
MEPYQFWHALPRSLRTRLRETGVYDVGRQLNEWLWRTDVYVRSKYDFTWVIVSFDEFETGLYVPTNEQPWWREYEEYGCHEPLTSKTLFHLVEKGDTVWDMGSRLGYFSTLAADLNRSPERVHTFESSISRWRFIEENNHARFNGAMHVNNVRIGDSDTDRTVTGDTYARRHGTPDVVKIDIEGAEVAALRGMKRVIERHKPALIIEAHPDLIKAADGHDTDEKLLELLQQYYDDIRISFDFRRPDGDWVPVETRWGERFDIPNVAEGEHDYYQLLCQGR